MAAPDATCLSQRAREMAGYDEEMRLLKNDHAFLGWRVGQN
jgi:hypothetical protein